MTTGCAASTPRHGSVEGRRVHMVAGRGRGTSSASEGEGQERSRLASMQSYRHAGRAPRGLLWRASRPRRRGKRKLETVVVANERGRVVSAIASDISGRVLV